MDEDADFAREIQVLVEEAKRKREHKPGQRAGGACYLQKGVFKTCFDDVTPEQCDEIARTSNSIVLSYVPGETCPPNSRARETPNAD
ncbi:hypothetical protein [Paraburkholderia sp. 35.1]|uniref:hypothetical protein n=1 Tax=Paraburkholderia sp. 35.1 TaxID=2991058 RepID=UPI003D1CA90E